MTDKEEIELLMLRVCEMRNAQRLYFKFKDQIYMKEAKAKEARVDDLVYALKRRGFDPNNMKDKTEQNKLF